MRKCIYILFLFVVFISCDDDFEVKHTVLPDYQWRLEELRFSLGAATFDAMKVFGRNLDSEPVVILNFIEDSTYYIDDTLGILTFAGLLSKNGTWEYNSDSTYIILNKDKPDDLTLSIKNLTESDMKLETTVHISDLDLSDMEDWQRSIFETVKTSDVFFDFQPIIK